MFSPEPEIKLKQLICQYLISSFTSLGYGIACIIIYSMNEYIDCTTKGISLQNWVLGSGIVYCITPGFNALIFGIKDKIGAIIYFSYMFFLYLPFNVAWSIVGSVMLFKYSMSCTDNPLWQMAVFSLVFHWITILFILWELRNKYIKK